MKKRIKRILISALVAAFLEAGLVVLASVAQQTSNGQDIFTLCFTPFYIIAALLTHNAEDTSGMLVGALMFMFFFSTAYLTQVIWGRAGKDSHDA